MRYGKYRFVGTMLVLPVALYAVFVISPMLQSIYYSFTDWSGLSANRKWVGLQNYRTLIHDDVFRRAVEHNIYALIIIPIVTIVLGLFFAAMLNMGGRKGVPGIVGVRGSGFYKIVFFFPYVLSIVVVGALWGFIFESTSDGLLNSFLHFFGVSPVDWTGGSSTALWSIFGVVIWASVGFYVVLFSAAMGSVPTELFEAIRLDGANRWTTFFKLTLPLIWDSVQVGVVYIMIQALDLFAIVQVLSAGNNGGPDNSTQVMSVYLYQTAFRYGHAGLATAMGVAMLILTLLVSAITLRASRRERLEF